MKKAILLLLILSGFNLFSQEAETVPEFKKNELKLNALILVVGAADITYERLLNEESGVGISVFAALDKSIYTRFYVSPYYRFYFGKKPAAGFFVEGFGMLNHFDDSYDAYIESYQGFDSMGNPILYQNYYKGKKITDFALGFGLGGKWVTKRGIFFEIFGGIGRNLFNSNDNDFYGNTIVGKGSVAIGYRF